MFKMPINRGSSASDAGVGIYSMGPVIYET